jgi:CBS domain-containing protein
MMNEPISSIMSTNVVALNVTDDLSAVMDILKKNRVHHLPVVDGKKLVGIVTSWDLLKLNRTFEEYQNIKVSDVMTRKLAVLEPNMHIGSAAEVLLANLFHAIPIVNDDYELMGIVTAFDILRYEHDKEYPPFK